MSELSPSGGSEGYGACDDAVDVGDDGKISDFGLIGHGSASLQPFGIDWRVFIAIHIYASGVHPFRPLRFEAAYHVMGSRPIVSPVGSSSTKTIPVQSVSY